MLAWRNRRLPLSGRIAGTELRSQAGNGGALLFEAVGDQLRIGSASGDPAQGQAFQRAANGACS
jgi:hypothetical protein